MKLRVLYELNSTLLWLSRVPVNVCNRRPKEV
jgi:hypothetical protein